MRAIGWAAAVAASLALASCGQGAAGGPPSFTTPEPQTYPVEDGEVEVSFNAIEDQGRAEGVVLRLAMQNPGPDTARTGTPAPEPLGVTVTVTDSGGDRVWGSDDEGAVTPAIMLLVELMPGEAAKHDVPWDLRSQHGDPLPAGDYQVTGRTRIDTGTGAPDTDIELTIDLEIPPRDA